MENTYPRSVEDINKHMQNISTRLFGNRFMPDQTLYEYLIEFLLVFVSAKDSDLKTGKMKFHDNSQGRLEYWIEPRMGLRRFIFYDKSRKNGAVSIDEYAYTEILKILKGNISVDNEADKQDILDGIQDLLHGYAVVIKKRTWCAQALLPVCPEMVLCDAMPNQKCRKNLNWGVDEDQVDKSFDFDKRNFLARGGEVYYLHLIQALENNYDSKDKLEKLLLILMGGVNNKLSVLCNVIQNSWEKSLNFSKNYLSKHMSLSFIPEDAYVECGHYSIDELINYLSSELPSINKIEVLAKGIMFQIMRMLSWRVDNYLGNNKKSWIVDMKGASTDAVKKIAAENFRNIEDGFMTALNKSAREIGITESEYMTKLNKAKKSSLDIFRSKGKEIQCIIPTNGQFERFSLSEDVIKFLVLSLVPPRKKMTLNMFLEKLYLHYGIVIGPEEYRKSIDYGSKLEMSLSNSFTENVNAFQAFLKATGFLRELSDATSIVVNPYNNVLED
jgi:hypothetical protein